MSTSQNRVQTDVRATAEFDLVYQNADGCGATFDITGRLDPDGQHLTVQVWRRGGLMRKEYEGSFLVGRNPMVWQAEPRKVPARESGSPETMSQARFVDSYTIYAGDVYYVPFLSTDGRVGYVVRNNETGDEQRETYLYFNPADSTDDGVPNVFIYMGGDNDPAVDPPYLKHIVIDFDAEATSTERKSKDYRTVVLDAVEALYDAADPPTYGSDVDQALDMLLNAWEAYLANSERQPSRERIPLARRAAGEGRGHGPLTDQRIGSMPAGQLDEEGGFAFARPFDAAIDWLVAQERDRGEREVRSSAPPPSAASPPTRVQCSRLPQSPTGMLPGTAPGVPRRDR